MYKNLFHLCGCVHDSMNWCSLFCGCVHSCMNKDYFDVHGCVNQDLVVSDCININYSFEVLLAKNLILTSEWIPKLKK